MWHLPVRYPIHATTCGSMPFQVGGINIPRHCCCGKPVRTSRALHCTLETSWVPNLAFCVTSTPQKLQYPYPVFKWLFHWEYTQHFQTNREMLRSPTPRNRPQMPRQSVGWPWTKLRGLPRSADLTSPEDEFLNDITSVRLEHGGTNNEKLISNQPESHIPFIHRKKLGEKPCKNHVKNRSSSYQSQLSQQFASELITKSLSGTDGPFPTPGLNCMDADAIWNPSKTYKKVWKTWKLKPCQALLAYKCCNPSRSSQSLLRLEGFFGCNLASHSWRSSLGSQQLQT